MSKSSSSQVRKMEKIEPAKSVYLDTGHPIPETYNEDRLVIVPRDPYWIFSYWEVTERKKQQIRKKHGAGIFEKAQTVLRIHDVTGVQRFTGKNSLNYKDVTVTISVRNWYINVEKPGRSYCVQLGLKTKAGEFIPILLSNTVVTPAGRISDVTDSQWMLVSEEYERLLKLSGIDKLGASSLDITRLLAKRWEFLSGEFSGSFSGVSSRSFKMAVGKPGKFRLIADAELIVYGDTEPTAALTINAQSVKLNPDGTFLLRVDFPDGKKEFAIKAVSADKSEQRKITITAERKTI